MTWITLGCQIACLALAYAGPALPWRALGAVGFLGLAISRLDLALIIALAVSPFYLPNESNPLPPRPIGVGNWSLSLVEFVILASTVAWLCRIGQTNWPAVRAALTGKAVWLALARQAIQALSPAVVFFAVVATASLATTFYLKVALREYRTVVAEPLLFYAMLLTTFRDQPSRLAHAYIGVGIGVAAIALLHYFLVGTVEATGGVRRVLAIYHSPNALALFLERPLALAMVLGFVGTGRRRLALLAGTALMLIVLVLTYSRGAWLAVCAGALFAIAVGWGRWRPLAIALASLAVGAAGFLASGHIARLTSTITVSRRIDVWLSALAMLRDHPITGVGLDNFLYYYRDRGYIRPSAAVEPNLSHPHNLVLDWWLRIGVLGPVALFWLVATALRDGFQVWRRSPLADRRALALGLMTTMVTGLVHGTVDNNFFLVDLAVSFWVVYGLLRLLGRQLQA